MTHIALHPHEHHQGTSHLGEVGFYSLLGIAAVVLLSLFGLYALSQNALRGVVALATGI